MTLVENEFSFSLSTDDEYNDAEATDNKYEKEKQNKKSKTKCSKKFSKKKEANSNLPDNQTDEPVEEEEGEDLEKGENITPKDMPNKEAIIESPTFRSKSTVYNTSQLTGWYSFFH